MTIDVGKMCDRGWYHTSEHFTLYLDLADGGGTRSSGDGTGSGEGPGANRVQRTARSLCTDHYGHVGLRPTARPETEPQGSRKTASRWEQA